MTQPIKAASGRLYVGDPGAALADMIEVGSGILDVDLSDGEASLPLSTSTHEMAATFDVGSEMLAALTGAYGDWEMARRAFALTTTSIESPFGPPPHKRRGLTGKAYRIARRRHARLRRDYARGLLPGVHVRSIARVGQAAVGVEFAPGPIRGQRFLVMEVDEVESLHGTLSRDTVEP